MKPAFRFTLFLSLIVAASAIIVIVMLTALEWRRTTVVKEYQLGNIGLFKFGTIRPYETYLSVISIDTEARTMLVSQYSGIINQVVPTLIHIDTNFIAERRDAKIENGVVVGTGATFQIQLEDIPQGAVGIGLLQTNPDGTFSIRRLTIGVPFPRP